MKIHFIAIGGSIMHNLAIALYNKGDEVTGSDDEIFEPARGNLLEKGLLPPETGWFPEKITSDLDTIILGMHAKADNPELVKAHKLGLKIYSFPEFLYEHAKNKKRVVIGGSHGKTTITSMIMHVLKKKEMKFDYMVGAQLKGFDIMVGLSEEAPLMVFEGDEYLTSALDLKPKFHWYKPHVAVISGIEWDHMNVFPTKANYIDQFVEFSCLMEKNAKLIYCQEDKLVCDVIRKAPSDVKCIPYSVSEHLINEDGYTIIHNQKHYPLRVFGEHNLLNINAAMLVCRELGITEEDFFEFMTDYEGAAKRLQCLYSSDNFSVFKDFAHAPSKLRATLKAVRSRFPERKITAIMELHTYSSLNKEFLPEYADTMNSADKAIVYFDFHALEIKRLPALDKEDVKHGFNRDDLIVIRDSKELDEVLKQEDKSNAVFLFMSSGNFGGLDLNSYFSNIASNS